MFKSVSRIFSQERAIYLTGRDFAVRLYDDFLLRNQKKPLPLRRGIMQFRLKGVPTPLAARVGTTDFFTVNEIYRDGQYAGIRRWLAPPVRTVLDLGANAGYSVRFWTDNFPDCRVWAAEPNPSNAMVCRKNIELGGASNRVRLMEAAVVGTSGKTFLDTRSLENGYQVTQDATTPGALAIHGITVAELIGDLPGDTPIDLLKCDIEGSERAVFASCEKWIKRVRFLAVETHGDYRPENLISDVAKAGGNFEVVDQKDADRSAFVFMRSVGT